MYKAKFHYDIQVADLVSDLAIDKLVPVCDQLATFLDRKQVADWFELPGHVERARTSLRPAFDPYELVGNRVCDQVCDLDSVMEFSLYRAMRSVEWNGVNN